MLSALVAHTEMQLFHAFHFIADILQGADGTVRRQSLQDMGERAGDGAGLFGRGLQGGIIRLGVGDEDHGGVEDVGADIFARGVCLPSDNKMTVEQQDRIIEVIRACFE